MLPGRDLNTSYKQLYILCPISGEAVAVEDEVVVINSIVLPNKTLNVSVQEEIILWYTVFYLQ